MRHPVRHYSEDWHDAQGMASFIKDNLRFLSKAKTGFDMESAHPRRETCTGTWNMAVQSPLLAGIKVVLGGYPTGFRCLHIYLPKS